MRRVTMPAPLRGAKTILFLLAAVTLSLIFALYDSRPTKAEGLLYTVTCTVGKLLSYECRKTTPPPSNSPSETPAQPTSPGPTEAPTPTTTGMGGAVDPVAPAPAAIDQELLDELPKVPEVATVVLDEQGNIAAYAFPSGYGSPDEAALGSADAQPIRPSEAGWMILGVQWVWWGAGALVLAGLAYLTRHVLAKSPASIAS